MHVAAYMAHELHNRMWLRWNFAYANVVARKHGRVVVRMHSLRMYACAYVVVHCDVSTCAIDKVKYGWHTHTHNRESTDAIELHQTRMCVPVALYNYMHSAYAQ